MDLNKLLSVIGFDWDEGNIDKNWTKHKVSSSECEQIFFNQPLIIAEDIKHPLKESRFYGLGRTDSERLLFVVFAVRNKHIRIISARDMSKKARRVYHDQETK